MMDLDDSVSQLCSVYIIDNRNTLSAISVFILPAMEGFIFNSLLLLLLLFFTKHLNITFLCGEQNA